MVSMRILTYILEKKLYEFILVTGTVVLVILVTISLGGLVIGCIHGWLSKIFLNIMTKLI